MCISNCTRCRHKKAADGKARDAKRDKRCPHPECTGVFTRKEKLNAHINSDHKKIKNIKCEVDGCDYVCSQQAHLDSHNKSKHAIHTF